MRQRGRDLEQRQRARPVVVDARALGDAVAVPAEHHAVVRVAAGGLRDDVGRLDVGDDGVDVRDRVDGCAGAQLLQVRRGVRVGEAEGGDVVFRRRAERAGQAAGVVVVDDGGGGTGFAGVGGLGAEGTGAAADEGDPGACHVGGEVALATSVVFD